ncbi:WD40/YVTN repeat-like-containing domain [Lasallia pustulata]|uniref:WD40/YVTN repeat-like-containing domain n=1 Tax=Lasallia pustulata TaxID=136370 RepID=A0A1W5D509_9LECA|nr:WD40/YVTN repeat-like-containing domain [Lasallia pustulata]
MAPAPPRKSVPKDRFAALFSTLKTQTYHDPASRTPGSHTIRSIAWSPTGAYIATGSADRTLRIWNPEKPQVKNSTELRGHSAGIERVAWNPTKEAELASASTDGTCRFWDVRSKSCVASVPLGGEGITIACTLPPPTLQTQHTLPAHTSSILSLSLSPSGRHLALGGSDALISLWDTTDWVCRHTLSSTVGAVRSVGFSFDGSYVAGGSDEGGGVEIVSFAFSELVLHFRGGGFGNERRGEAGANKGWQAHVETGEVVCSIGTAAPAPCVAWHPGRYWVAYSGDAGGLKIVGAGGGGL